MKLLGTNSLTGNYVQPRQQVRIRRKRYSKPRLEQSNYQDAKYRVLPDEEQPQPRREQYSDNPFGTSKNYHNDEDDDYNPVSATDEEYVTEQTRRMDELKIKKHEMKIAAMKGREAERKEDREQNRKTKAERIAQLKLRIAQRKKLQRRLKRDKNITGLVRGLGSAFTPRVKISPQGRRALISQAVQQSEDYNARNTFFKKREGSKISFFGRGNV